MFTIRYLVLYLALDGPVSAFLWQTPPKEACQPNAGSKGCVTSIGRRTSARSLSCRLVLLAGGFGASGDNKSPASKASGSAEAKAALRSSNGDLDRATSIVFRERLAKLQEGDSELADMLNSMLAAGRTSPTPPMKNEVALHEALVSATWDAVAIMNTLPKSRKTSADDREEKRIAKRLKSIADAARSPPASRNGFDTTGAGDEPGLVASGSAQKPPFVCIILDIGCGDGTLMPHLLDEPVKQNPPSKARKKAVKKGKLDMPAEEEERRGGSISPATVVQEADVTGVDLSEVMISSARQKYPKARWLVGNALALPSLLGMDRPEPLFSSVVFNGSLQFFRDPAGALSDAAGWLVDGGHIVIAHVQGSDFVRDECRRNPRVAPSPMPGREGMEEWAARAGCSLLEGPDDLSQRDFLLYVMKKSL